MDPIRQGNELLLQSRGQRVMVEKALLCTGRRPNLSGLGLEELDLETDAHGVPVFDRESMRIGDSPIFIAGDVNNERAILHEANDEGHLAHLLAWAIQQKLTVFDILRFPYYHPTVEEGLQSALRNGMKKLSCERSELQLLMCRSASLKPLC